MRQRLAQVLGSQEIAVESTDAIERRFWSPAGLPNRTCRATTVVDLGRWIAARSGAL